MILGKVELLVMAILLSKNIAQCDDRARRDDRAAVGWAWTGRNLILDEALIGLTFSRLVAHAADHQAAPSMLSGDQTEPHCLLMLASQLLN